MPLRVTFLYILGFTVFAGCGAAPSSAQVPTRELVDSVQDVQLPDDPAAILAVVNRSPILLGEISPKVEARIKEVLEKSSQRVPEDQLHFARVNLVRGLLAQAIQNKMMRESFLLDQVGTESADKRAEADNKLATRARQMFHETELPELMKRYDAVDMNALDAELRKQGSSLAGRQRDFVDAMLGHLYLRSKVNREPEVSLAEINEYYESHLEDYKHAARARWEQLTVLFKNFDGRQEAHRAIWEMGREAYFGGETMQPVARARSQEPFAKQGGLHDWTSQGSLVSQPLDEQIFSIPLGKMSNIIEDEDGLHIVRVLEREPAGVTPRSEVQEAIRATIQEQKIEEAQKKVFEEMTERIPVWSLFPEDTPGAKPLPESIAKRALQKSIR